MGILCRLPGIAYQYSISNSGIPNRKNKGEHPSIYDMLNTGFSSDARVAPYPKGSTALTVLASSLYNIKMHLYDKNQDRFLLMVHALISCFLIVF